MLCWCALPHTLVSAQGVLTALDFKHLLLKMIYQQSMSVRGRTLLEESEGKERCLVMMEVEKNRGQKGLNQQKKKLAARKVEREDRRISDNNHATSSTNLASDGQYVKYSRFDTDSDRVELLSATDHDPSGSSSFSATSSGYGRSSSSRAPRNIFDDL